MSLSETLRARDGWAAALRLAALRGSAFGGVLLILSLVGGDGVSVAVSNFVGAFLVLGLPALVESWARQRAWHPALGAALTYPVALAALMGGLFQGAYAYATLSAGAVDPARSAELLDHSLKVAEDPAFRGGVLIFTLVYAAVAWLRLGDIRARWPAGTSVVVGGALLAVMLSMGQSGISQRPAWVKFLMAMGVIGGALMALLTMGFAAVDWIERRVAAPPDPRVELAERRRRPGLIAAVVLVLAGTTWGLSLVGASYAETRAVAKHEAWKKIQVAGTPALLASTKAADRKQAAMRVKTFSPDLDHLLPQLGPLLSDPDEDVRQAALSTLKSRPAGVPVALGKLSELLTADDPAVRREAAWDLVELGRKRARPAVSLLLELSSEDEEAGAVAAVAAFHIDRDAFDAYYPPPDRLHEGKPVPLVRAALEEEKKGKKQRRKFRIRKRLVDNALDVLVEKGR